MAYLGIEIEFICLLSDIGYSKNVFCQLLYLWKYCPLYRVTSQIVISDAQDRHSIGTFDVNPPQREKWTFFLEFMAAN